MDGVGLLTNKQTYEKTHWKDNKLPDYATWIQDYSDTDKALISSVLYGEGDFREEFLGRIKMFLFLSCISYFGDFEYVCILKNANKLILDEFIDREKRDNNR